MRFLGLFVLFTFIPALYGLPVLERGCFKKVCLLRVLLIIITSLTVPIAAWFVLRKYHWYEYLLLDSVVANFLSTILIPFFENRKKFSYKNVLRFFCFFALSVALYSTLTFGQTLINSDAATATILADSQLRHKSLFPATWNYANGEIWVFAINIVTMPFIRFVKNQSLARMFGSVIWISMACTSVVFLAKKLLKDSSWLISVPFLVLFFTGFENLDSVDMILYQAAYIGQVTLLCIPLTLFWYNYSNFQNKNDNAISEKRKYLILLTFMFLIFLFSLGGIRFIVEFILPLLITICIFSLIETPDFDLKKIKELVFLLIAIIIPSVIGFVFYKKLCFTHNVNNSKNFSLFFCGSTKEYWNNFQGVFINHFENFGFSPNVSVISIAGLKNFVIIFFTLIVSFIVPVLQLIRIRTEEKNIVFICLFSLIHNTIMFLIIIFMGGKQNPRYLLPSQFLEIIISARYIYVYWIKRNNFINIKNFIIFIIIVGISINAMYFINLSKGWYSKLEQRKAYTTIMKASGCKKGYATYWNAYSNEIYCDLNIRFGGIKFDGNKITPHYWLVDSDVFNYSNNEPSFLLLDCNQMDYTKDNNIEKIYGKPNRILTYLGYTIYVFDYDIASKFIGIK